MIHNNRIEMRIIPWCLGKTPLLDSFQSGDQARGNRPGGDGARGLARCRRVKVSCSSLWGYPRTAASRVRINRSSSRHTQHLPGALPQLSHLASPQRPADVYEVCRDDDGRTRPPRRRVGQHHPCRGSSSRLNAKNLTFHASHKKTIPATVFLRMVFYCAH